MTNVHFPALLVLASGSAFGQTPDAMAPDDPTRDAVARFSCASALSSAREDAEIVDAAYGERAVAIVRAGLADDQVSLAYMIAPEAQVVTHRGDMSSGPRVTGAAAIAEWARTLRPRSFRYAVVASGPVSTDPCGDRRLALILEGGRPDQTVDMEFRFRGGLLVRAVGNEIRVHAGALGASARP